MKNLLISTIFLITFVITSYADEIKDCSTLSKFSTAFYKCKSNNFVKDTKNYQKKEWSEEKKKINEIKKKVLDK